MELRVYTEASKLHLLLVKQANSGEHSTYIFAFKKNIKFLVYSYFVSRLINYVTKGGASMANSLGVITIMYTCAGIGLTWLRGTDDSFNTVAAAATSAAVFRSPGTKNNLYTCTYRVC